MFVSLFALLPAPALRAQGTQQSVGLVLSGGGARGIAHVGLIKALEDNNIPIDYVTGTSMGSIVGGLYACGYTPEEMMALFNSEYFQNLSTGTVDPQMAYSFTSPALSPQMFFLPLGRTDSTSVFNPQSVVNPMPMDFAFTELFSAYTAQCDSDFTNLFVPFRCVASNVEGRCKHVLSGGSLGHSIRASMSFPLVYQATMIDSIVLYDGGIYDNFPVDVMQADFAPDIMIGCVVKGKSSANDNSFMNQLELLVTDPQSYALTPGQGIKITVDLSDFSLLDFSQAEAIYRKGYDTAMEMIDSIAHRVQSRTTAPARTLRREVFKCATPYLRFDSVAATGGTPRQNEYLQYLFSPAPGTDTLGTTRARQAYYRALSTGKYSMLRPYATESDSSGLFTLNLETRVKPPFGAAAGGYITSTDNSFVYLRGEYRPLSFRAVNAKAEAWIGQSYMAGVLAADYFLHTPVPSAVNLTVCAWRRRYFGDEHMFFSTAEPGAMVKHQYYARAAFALAAGRTGQMDVGLAAGRLQNSFYPGFDHIQIESGRQSLRRDLSLAFVQYQGSTLDNPLYPFTGQALRLHAAGVREHAWFFPIKHQGASFDDKSMYLRFHGDWKGYFPLHKHWSLGLEAAATYTSRHLLPNYYAALSAENAFIPTPAADASFRTALHADSYLALGLVPVYSPAKNLTVRWGGWLVAPLRDTRRTDGGGARRGGWFGARGAYTELCVNYRLPFANLNAYTNYDSSHGRFGAGLSLGFYFLAPGIFGD